MKVFYIRSKNYGTKAVLIDDNDIDKILSLGKWHVMKQGNNFYAINDKRKGKRIITKMHRFILGINDPKINIDHNDGNGLNNQRDNLRISTKAENCINSRTPKNNTSGYKGVYFDKRKKRFIARVMFNRKQIFLGSYDEAKAAAIAYNLGALQYYGEFAKLNQT